jgi:glycosyltransferase involved in cell wall biosynthesis
MTIKKVKKILYMGCYLDNYNRNVIFIDGLRKNGLIVYEYNVESHSIIKNIKLFLKNFKKLKSQNFDLILFHSEAHIQFYLAKILASIMKIPLVHDIFISKLQTIYDDRKQFRDRKIPKIIFRIILYTVDLIECTFANYIVLDTYSHIKFFHEKFKVPLKKFSKVYVGARDDIYFPLEKEKKEENKFVVGFWGTYIPLHGIDYIIKAAKLLEKEEQIKFIIIGKGQLYKENRKFASELNVNNIEFIPKNFIYINQLDKLQKLISQFDIGLGIFGDGAKPVQVIPNKIFEGIAMKIPMITCRSPAIRELFTDNENIILCERANPESLAKAILKLKNDINLRIKIKENAYQLFLKHCSIDAIGKTLLRILNNILIKKYKHS